MIKINTQRIARARYCGACSILVLATILASGPAAAAAADAAAAAADTKSTALEEVVVTARKVAENQQSVPVAVTAFTSDDLRQQSALRITDVGRLTPGIMFRQSSTNPSGLLVMMRGQFQRDTTAVSDPSVGTYVDGVYWARSYGLNADLLDLQNVQILKGPQGTLFGRNTTGGAVLMQTNDPNLEKASGMASVTYGRFNERIGTVVVNLPIVTDRVAVRGALQIDQRDGYMTDYVTGRKYENRDNVTGRLKLGVKATDDLNFVFSAERYRFNEDGQARTLFYVAPGNASFAYATAIGPAGGLTMPAYIAFAAANKNSTGQDSLLQPIGNLNNAPKAHYDTETDMGTGTWDTKIGTFKLIGAYRGVKGQSSLDLDGSPWAEFTTFGYSDLKQYSAELQLTGNALNNALSYVGGAFWFKESGLDGSMTENYAGPVGLSPGSGGNRSENDARVENKSTGAYAQLSWHATDRLTFTGGLRYSVDDRGFSLVTLALNPKTLLLAPTAAAPGGCLQAAIGAVPISSTYCSAVSRTDTYKSGSYLASADYKLTDDVMAYAKYSKGNRSGGENGRATSPAIFNSPFGPEINHEAEIGLKSELFERRLRLNIAAYRNTIDGAQRQTRDLVGSPPLVASLYLNAAKVRVNGVEVEATAVLGGGFRVSASGAYTKPEYLSYRTKDGVDHSTDRFNGVPEYQSSFLARYEHDLAFANLSAQVDYSWASSTPLDETINPANNPAAPADPLWLAATTRPAGGEVNARAALSFQDGLYEVSIYGKNILDNRDKVSVLVLGTQAGGTWREPASYGVQAVYHFGR